MLRVSPIIAHRAPAPGSGLSNYMQWRELFLTCHQESSWCSKHLRFLRTSAMQFANINRMLQLAFIERRLRVTRSHDRLTAKQLEYVAYERTVADLRAKLYGVAAPAGVTTTAAPTAGTFKPPTKAEAKALKADLAKAEHGLLLTAAAVGRLHAEFAATRVTLQRISAQCDDVSETDMDAILKQIGVFKGYLRRIKVSQKPFIYHYRRLKEEGRDAEAEELLVGKYSAILEGRHDFAMSMTQDDKNKKAGGRGSRGRGKKQIAKAAALPGTGTAFGVEMATVSLDKGATATTTATKLEAAAEKMRERRLAAMLAPINTPAKAIAVPVRRIEEGINRILKQKRKAAKRVRLVAKRDAKKAERLALKGNKPTATAK